MPSLTTPSTFRSHWNERYSSVLFISKNRYGEHYRPARATLRHAYMAALRWASVASFVGKAIPNSPMRKHTDHSGDLFCESRIAAWLLIVSKGVRRATEQVCTRFHPTPSDARVGNHQHAVELLVNDSVGGPHF